MTMTTTTKNFDPKDSENSDPKKAAELDAKRQDSGLIDTTEIAEKETKKDSNEAADKETKKSSKEELLEKAKNKVRTEEAEKVEDGFAYVHVAYSGQSALPVEKRNVNGVDLHVLPVTINGKEYLVEVNKQVKVPLEVKEAIENTTHRGTPAKPNEPTLLS